MALEDFDDLAPGSMCRCDVCARRVEVAETTELLIVPPHLQGGRYAHESFEARAESVRACWACAEGFEGPWTRVAAQDSHTAADVFRYS
jgi:DNA gyrase inhibitor GyrI